MNSLKTDEDFLLRAIELANENISKGGGPFGAVIVENGKIIAETGNKVRIINDPTAHAEVQAIRIACDLKQSFSLENCTIYSSCEPCPMCLGAIYWAKIPRLIFSANKQDAAKAGFDDKKIYDEINKKYSDRDIETICLDLPEGKNIFTNWLNSPDILKY